jgi:hypothetical protein
VKLKNRQYCAPVGERQYVERAKVRILEQHLAVVVLELEARISEAGFADASININPHHITTALRELTADDAIIRVLGTTRGGSDVTTIQPANQHKRTTAIAQAASRKRLLYARYLSWAQSSVRHPSGRMGPAGEESVRLALRASGALQPALPDFREVGNVLGVDLPGPVDSAGYMVHVRRPYLAPWSPSWSKSKTFAAGSTPVQGSFSNCSVRQTSCTGRWPGNRTPTRS